ncbi:hypothetical protein Ciccas_003496 [Cichlidogyrus casuarinus]|uniref:Uncharacterized protein n=1 Tax=Cichlidogyrus casuarinus TaxID=1844966 RepID=A0ABD2QE81_9PLAT
MLESGRTGQQARQVTVDQFCQLSAAGGALENFIDLTMGEDEILRLHWNLQRRMNLVSNTLQRWFVCWTLFSVVWSLTYIVGWLKPSSTPTNGLSSLIEGSVGVCLLALPCILVWLMISAYAEVNAEVNNLLRAIYPLEGSRITFLRISMPIKGQQAWQVGLFGVPVTHATAVTVVIALGVTISARMLWAELSRSFQLV